MEELYLRDVLRMARHSLLMPRSQRDLKVTLYLQVLIQMDNLFLLEWHLMEKTFLLERSTQSAQMENNNYLDTLRTEKL
jgi:hypothetical protein